MSRLPVRGCLAGLVALVLASCTVPPLHKGLHDAADLATERGVPAAGAAGTATADALPTGLLAAGDAVRLAVANNAALRGEAEGLGFAIADLQDGRRIRNPVLAATRLNNPAGHDEVALGVVAVLADIVTLPARSRAARANYDAAKQALAASIIDTAAAAEAAYYAHVAARQAAALQAQIAQTAGVSSALAERFAEAGNLAPRALARERAAASEARLAHLDAEAEAHRTRAALALAMGLSSGDAWQVPAQLPAPVPEVPAETLEHLLPLALAKRLDLAAGKAAVDSAATRLGIERSEQWLGEVEIGLESERHDGGELRGPAMQWQLPLPPARGALTRRRTALRLAALEVARLRQLIDTEVRTTYAAMQSAKLSVDEYRTSLLPARQAATEHTEAERNYMLVGIFEALAEKQQEYAAYHGYLAAVRDYHLARSALRRAVGMALPADAEAAGEPIDVAGLVRPASEHRHGKAAPGATE